ncbi:predicted protein [Lichtheimia corymbifera JMRC:FSU:9682]|uniref:Uncharacterized protein n=1 Tax=Lichtheimia corymbifera JMRC:FSU:9682 TaxID=1263082 RepID=A0A068S7U1_9FUNG|nr:predicted protein [Lichtheimia corymbifera JMRC:FSU:9682]
MKTTFILVLFAIFAIAFGAPCHHKDKPNHGHHDHPSHHGGDEPAPRKGGDITQVQSAGAPGNNNSGIGGLLGLSALNGDINILGKQVKSSSTTMTQNANA